MKHRLDEREQQVVSKSCQWGLYAMYVILLPALVVKSFILQMPLEYFWVEALALILSGVVQFVISAHGAVFDFYFRPTLKTYLFLSLIPAFIAAVPSWFGLKNRYIQYQQPDGLGPLAVAVGMIFLSSYLLALFVLSGIGIWVKRRKRQMDRELDKEDTEDTE
ncbi:MAG: DUF6773 family protein [Lawsonibacter sp.]|jgi:hypothetical protein